MKVIIRFILLTLTLNSNSYIALNSFTTYEHTLVQ